MQDRYVADVGDFGKYGLLRCLTGMTCSPKKGVLKLGVIWYLTPSCLGNSNDGKHLGYLDQPQKFEDCDKELFQKLKALRKEITFTKKSRLIRNKRLMRTEKKFEIKDPALKRIQDLRLLGTDLFYDKPLRGDTDRAQWWKGASEMLKGKCDLVFMDPDNGLRVQFGRGGAKLLGQNGSSQKHVGREEIRDVLNKWKVSAVVYHHLGRHAGSHDSQIRRIKKALADLAPRTITIRALRYRRGSSRAFFVLIQEKQKHKILQSRVDRLADSFWAHKNHFQVVS